MAKKSFALVMGSLVLVALGLMGCDAAPTTPPTVTAVPAPTSGPAPTLTPPPTPMPTPAPTPTPTRAPTLTPTPTPTPTAAPTSTPTASPTPTPTALPTATPNPSIEQAVSGALRSVVRVSAPDTEGTGFVVETQGDTALVVTAYHLVDAAGKIEVEDSEGHWHDATLLGYHAYRDIAMLSVCCGSFEVLPLVDPLHTVNVGAEVLAIGYSLGIEGTPTVTRGIVSAVRRDEDMDAWLIQTDAPIQPGQSGGPLIDRSGKAVGLNAFVYEQAADGSRVEALGFAVSARTIARSLRWMSEGGRISLPTPTPTPPAQWLSYSSDERGWSLEYPHDWKVHDADPANVEFESPDEFAAIWVVTADWSSDSAFDKIDMLIEDYEALDLALLDFTEFTAGFYEGDEDHYAVARLKYQRLEKYCVEESMAKFIVIGGQGYALQWASCAHALDEHGGYRPVLEYMVESFVTR